LRRKTVLCSTFYVLGKEKTVLGFTCYVLSKDDQL